MPVEPSADDVSSVRAEAARAQALLKTTDRRGIITDVNRETEALTGCTRDELIGAPFKNYFTDPVRAEAGIRRAVAEGKVTNYELTARARNGKETIVSYNASTFYDRDRRLRGVFAAARDITELKHFEQTIQQSEVQRERDSQHAAACCARSPTASCPTGRSVNVHLTPHLKAGRLEMDSARTRGPNVEDQFEAGAGRPIAPCCGKCVEPTTMPSCPREPARETAPAPVAAAESRDMAKPHSRKPGLRLRLYVAGRASNSVRAIANARAICDEHFASGHELEIVDLVEHPTRALADGIIVTPTLLRLLPLPVRRVIGSLSDTSQVLMALSSR